MDILYNKARLLGRPFKEDGNGGEGGGESGGSAAGNAARAGMGFGGTGSGTASHSGGDNGRNGGYGSGGWSHEASYSGYTTGSDQNAVTQAHVEAQREADKTSNDGTSATLGLSLQAAAQDKPVSDLVGREMTKSELNGLSSQGLGDMQGVNPNNTTQSVDESIASRNMQGILSRAINFVPGVATVRSVANVAAGLADPNKSAGEVLGGAVSGLIGSTLASKANQAVFGALGSDAANAVRNYNQLASTANTFSPGSVSAINPAGMITGQLGLTGKQDGVMGNDKTTKLDGTAYSVGGWSADGPADKPSAPTPAPAQVPEPAPAPVTPPVDATPVNSSLGGFVRNPGFFNRNKLQRNQNGTVPR